MTVADRRQWTAAVALGALTLVLGGALLPVFPRGNAGLPPGFNSPIVAFEFARTEAEVEAIVVGPTAGDAKTAAARLDAFDAGNRLDYAFLLASGAFLFSVALTVRKDGASSARAAQAAMGLAVLASAADAVENLQLLALTDAARHHADMTAALGRLSIATWAKWGSLLLACNLLVPWLWRRGALGKVVAASLVVYGDLARLGEGFVLTLNLYDSEKARAAGRTTVRAADVEGVANGLRPAIVDLMGSTPQRPRAGRKRGLSRRPESLWSLKRPHARRRPVAAAARGARRRRCRRAAPRRCCGGRRRAREPPRRRRMISSSDCYPCSPPSSWPAVTRSRSSTSRTSTSTPTGWTSWPATASSSSWTRSVPSQ